MRCGALTAPGRARQVEQLCLGDLALFSQAEPGEFNSSWHRDARWPERTTAGGAAAGERRVAGDAPAAAVAREDRRRLSVAEKGGASPGR